LKAVPASRRRSVLANRTKPSLHLQANRCRGCSNSSGPMRFVVEECRGRSRSPRSATRTPGSAGAEGHARCGHGLRGATPPRHCIAGDAGDALPMSYSSRYACCAKCSRKSAAAAACGGPAGHRGRPRGRRRPHLELQGRTRRWGPGGFRLSWPVLGNLPSWRPGVLASKSLAGARKRG